MGFRTVFARTELKYLITEAEREALLLALSHRLSPDRYGRTTIANLYFDTPSYLLIRRSVEKPVYKEKLRMRAYGVVTPTDTVFAEIKKKYKSTVYKRRVALPEARAMAWLCGGAPPPDGQIARELDYFRTLYPSLAPRAYISYEREAYFDSENADFRITFDQNILFRDTELSLCKPPFGVSLLPKGRVLLEIKCAGGMPREVAALLSRLSLYKTSFSKYGTAYFNHILPKIKEKNNA